MRLILLCGSRQCHCIYNTSLLCCLFIERAAPCTFVYCLKTRQSCRWVTEYVFTIISMFSFAGEKAHNNMGNGLKYRTLEKAAAFNFIRNAYITRKQRHNPAIGSQRHETNAKRMQQHKRSWSKNEQWAIWRKPFVWDWSGTQCCSYFTACLFILCGKAVVVVSTPCPV